MKENTILKIKKAIQEKYSIDFVYKKTEFKNVKPIYENKKVCLCSINGGQGLKAFSIDQMNSVYKNSNNMAKNLKYLNFDEEEEFTLPKKKKRVLKIEEEFDEKDIDKLRKDFEKSAKEKKKVMPKIQDLVKQEKELKTKLSSIAGQLMGKK